MEGLILLVTQIDLLKGVLMCILYVKLLLFKSLINVNYISFKCLNISEHK